MRARAFPFRLNRNGSPSLDSCFDAFSSREPVATSLENALALGTALGDRRQQHGEHHEYGRGAEHPVRRVLVHDPAEQERADDAADIEAGGDDAEGAPCRAW